MAKNPKENAHLGRPAVYRSDEHPAAARLMAGKAKTHAEMAKVFGVERHTIADWKNDHPEFAAALALGRDDATEAVERALFERATGYTYPSEKIVTVSDGGSSHVERVPITEHCPPDATAMQFWLKNRKSKEWRDKSEVEVTGNLADSIAAARARAKKT